MSKNWLIGTSLVLFWGIGFAQPPHLPPLEKLRGEKREELREEKREELREEKREEAIEFLQKYMEPDRLKKLEAKHPMLYNHALREALKQKHRLERLKEADPERYELNEKILRMEIQCRNLKFDYMEPASKDEKKGIEKKLKSILPELFDLREKDREFELKRLEKEIAELKDIMANRKKHKAEIIERHLNELLQEEKYMRW